MITRPRRQARGGHGAPSPRRDAAIMELRYQTREGARGQSDHPPAARAMSLMSRRQCSARSRSARACRREGRRAGDYKRRPTDLPTVPVTTCDVFTPSGHRVPVFCHTPMSKRCAKLLKARADHQTAACGRRLCARQGAAGDRGCAAAGTTSHLAERPRSGCARPTDWGVH